MLFNLIIWSSLVWANEPPEIPFRPLDESMKAVKTGTQLIDNTNQTAIQSYEKQNQTAAIETSPAPVSDAFTKSKKKSVVLDKGQEPTTKTKKSQRADVAFQSSVTIKLKPGRMENAAIARDKLNPIITPYANPKVLTVDTFESKIDGSVVYVSTSTDIPISMFISDADSPDSGALSLQLMPQELESPVEIRIEAPPSKVHGLEASSLKGDALFRHDSPYVTDIKAIMQSLGKQQIPQGFTMDTVQDLNLAFVCHDANLTFIPGQLLSGHDSRILVMVAQNNGLTPSVFEETRCAGENVMAVAAWPKVRLEPGEKTEIFILMRLPQGKSGEEFRPALL